jgi:hypothetical protein
MKRCSKCKVEKPLIEFHVQRGGRGDGYQAYCKDCKNKALNAWRLIHLEECREKERNWYKKNPTKKRTYWLKNRDRHPELYLWKAAKQRAHKDGLYFTITPDDIKIPVTCPVLGIPISFGAKATEDRSHSPSLDRIDPKLGYVPGNIIVMSHKANTLKSNATVEELRALLAWMTQQENPTARKQYLSRTRN